MVKGIGPYFAKKLVRAFGEEVFDVIEQTPERLPQVDNTQELTDFYCIYADTPEEIFTKTNAGCHRTNTPAV